MNVALKVVILAVFLAACSLGEMQTPAVADWSNPWKSAKLEGDNIIAEDCAEGVAYFTESANTFSARCVEEYTSNPVDASVYWLVLHLATENCFNGKYVLISIGHHFNVPESDAEKHGIPGGTYGAYKCLQDVPPFQFLFKDGNVVWEFPRSPILEEPEL